MRMRFVLKNYHAKFKEGFTMKISELSTCNSNGNIIYDGNACIPHSTTQQLRKQPEETTASGK